MASEHSVTRWIALAKAGDEQAAQKLWERYFERLLRLARGHLDRGRCRTADEEDVVLAAFDSFFRAAKAGQFPRLRDRDDLWPLLVKITVNKAHSQRRGDRRQKRGRGLVRGESAFLGPSAEGAGIEQVIAERPTAEFAAELVDQFRSLSEATGDPELATIAALTMAGHTQEEIALKLGCTAGTVGRKLKLIRARWRRELVG